MFIQSETTDTPATYKFLPGRTVLKSGTVDFRDAESAKRSPLAARMFEIESVTGVSLGPDYILVTKADNGEWQLLKPAVLGVIMEHFVAGQPVLLDEEEGGATGEDAEDSELGTQIKELIETRIRPAIASDGGNIVFRGYEDGIVKLEMQGSAAIGSIVTLKKGIENMLQHYVPEVVEVRFMEQKPSGEGALGDKKPGLDTPEAKAIQELLDERVNPAVAAHGGRISLVDVQGDTAYIRLEGGCQGCGMADVTLKQGVEQEIKQVVPQITTVLDTTDHAGGANPYYQPGKGGMSPF